METTHIKTIGIIGAGLSGLVAAKTYLEYGFSVTVFEKDKELGGVWSSSRRYPGLFTQNPRDTYAFTDFPMPRHYPEWPSSEQVQAYLTVYATHFGVLPRIRFSSEVTNLAFENEQWHPKGMQVGKPFAESFDFLTICNGTFSDPHIPAIQGLDSFYAAGGNVLHTSQYNSSDLTKGKRIAVVGFSKSATDVVVAASETAQRTYMICREVKWKIPRFIGNLNTKYMFLNRLGEAMIKTRHHNPFEKLLHGLGVPDKVFARLEKLLIETQQLQKSNLVPKMRLQDLKFGEISMETDGFYRKAADGDIALKHGEIESCAGKEITLTSGEKIEVDVLIFGTGFRQAIPFLPEPYQKAMTDEQGNYILYRNILPPALPRLAFIGYTASLYSNLTSEFSALWLAEYLKGNIRKPADAEIIRENREFHTWRAQFRMNGFTKGLTVMPHSLHYVDTLMKDMKASLPLHSLIQDWLVVLEPSRYKRVKVKVMKRNGIKATA
jgi:cation diffusion facilitator CzcD-associated flavoprotein CzcO